MVLWAHVILLLLVTGGHSSPLFESCPNNDYIVAFKRGTGRLTKMQSSWSRPVRYVGAFNIEGSQREVIYGAFNETEVVHLRNDPEVDFVVCNEKVRSFASVNESACSGNDNSPYHLERLSSEDPIYSGLYKYNANAGDGVDIYVLDTGINIDHPDFEGRASIGVDFTDSEGLDRDGHGSHVAGIAAGRTYGVAKKANVISVKVLSDSGEGSFGEVFRGMEWIQQRSQETRRRAVCNFSLGGNFDEKINALFNEFVDGGFTVVVAAGNTAEDACKYSPASAEKVITVGASTAGDKRAEFSNFGDCVDIYAPGDNVKSLSNRGSGISVAQGTSQAAPGVAGLAALIISTNPSLTNENVKAAILDTALVDRILDIPSGSNRLAHIICDGAYQFIGTPANTTQDDKKELPIFLVVGCGVAGGLVFILTLAAVIYMKSSRRLVGSSVGGMSPRSAGMSPTGSHISHYSLETSPRSPGRRTRRTSRPGQGSSRVQSPRASSPRGPVAGGNTPR
eukprot:Plantae.Rhodophyta-Purpureofilum_apyrenoidigerum.ctg22997.p1 GENE.Plantae.Rhodophyta-Purpureofilum_apyrenoidigerum.ctg22997~~Plantae.Rhodophyta-Purpureofilum_apyrenoidigerum.ctg22997.p1  ORF type:complete len:526 (-),score=50.64 Plantae.Rhodophyta-Purpureofilum_apyrenoidigerum.ctg22997:176-1699(-)